MLKRRRKDVLILISKTSQISLKWKSRRTSFKTLSRRFPVDVLETLLRRLKTYSRLFLVKAEDNFHYINNFLSNRQIPNKESDLDWACGRLFTLMFLQKRFDVLNQCLVSPVTKPFVGSRTTTTYSPSNTTFSLKYSKIP